MPNLDPARPFSSENRFDLTEFKGREQALISLVSEWLDRRDEIVWRCVRNEVREESWTKTDPWNPFNPTFEYGSSCRFGFGSYEGERYWGINSTSRDYRHCHWKSIEASIDKMGVCLERFYLDQFTHWTYGRTTQISYSMTLNWAEERVCLSSQEHPEVEDLYRKAEARAGTTL